MLKTPEIRSLVACGLILATPFSAGCGASDAEKLEKKEQAREQKNERKLEKIFNRGMAEIGRKAVRYTESHPYTGGIYDVGAGEKQIDIDVGDTEIGLSLAKGTNTRKIKPGDVTGLLITKANPGKSNTEVRIESPAEDYYSDNPVFTGSAEGPYEETKKIQYKGEGWHITTSPYQSSLLNENLEPHLQTLTAGDAAERILISANYHFEQATKIK